MGKQYVSETEGVDCSCLTATGSISLTSGGIGAGCCTELGGVIYCVDGVTCGAVL